MFTGLVSAVGTVREATRDAGGVELTISAPWSDLAVGESIAVDGACLTVIAKDRDRFRVHIVTSSLDRTAFGTYGTERRVNLERALQVGDRLGGHLVAGHVDGVGVISRVATRQDARLLDIAVPAPVFSVSVPLGSVTVDGVSLTVNAIPAPGTVQVSLIPHTVTHTTLGDRKVGDRVHLEADMIGKYVKQLMNQAGNP